MLESVFIVVLAMAFVSLLMAVEREAIIYSAISIFFSIVLMGGQLYIESPGIATSYNEPWVVGMAIGLIAVNLIWIILLYFDIDLGSGRDIGVP